MHETLIKLRNELVAHDDLSYIEPRIIVTDVGVNIEGSKATVPVSIALANKSLLYQSSGENIDAIADHIKATAVGVERKLLSDVDKYRQLHLTDRDSVIAKRKHEEFHGTQEIPSGGAQLVLPRIEDDHYLNIETEEFSEQNGYKYEQLKIRRNFYGPDRIDLPNGTHFILNP